MVCSCIVRLSLLKPSMPIAFNCLGQAQADKGRLLLIAFGRLLMTSILIVHKVVYPSADKIPFCPLFPPEIIGINAGVPLCSIQISNEIPE